MAFLNGQQIIDQPYQATCTCTLYNIKFIIIHVFVYIYFYRLLFTLNIFDFQTFFIDWLIE